MASTTGLAQLQTHTKIPGLKRMLYRAVVSGALLQFRNTPDRDRKLSPVKALYGRELRDFLPRPGSALMGDMWLNLVDARETAQAHRANNSEKKWSEHTWALVPLKVGHTVMDRDSKLSPAKPLLGRELRDFLSRPWSALIGDMWMNLVDTRETAQARRAEHSEKEWPGHTMALAPLKVGDTVMLQNQSGNHPLRWDKRGTVLKCEGFDQCQVMIDRSCT
jgi:hypothetical protein